MADINLKHRHEHHNNDRVEEGEREREDGPTALLTIPVY